MFVSKSNKFHKKGFTLLELMIAVAIIGIIASMTMPFVSRMIYEAKVGEMTKALLETHRDLEAYRSRDPLNYYTIFLKKDQTNQSDCFNDAATAQSLACRGAIDSRYEYQKTNFNIITGSFDSSNLGGSDAYVALSQFPGNEGLQISGSPGLNAFGFMKISQSDQNSALPGSGAQYEQTKILIGAERNTDSDDSYEVIGMTETGFLFQICNDLTNQKETAGGTQYAAYTMGEPNCSAGDGSDDESDGDANTIIND